MEDRPKIRASRSCVVGDKVMTHFSGKITYHTIVEVCSDRSHGHSQSGIMFQVAPPVPKSGGGWIDADWFSPA